MNANNTVSISLKGSHENIMKWGHIAVLWHRSYRLRTESTMILVSRSQTAIFSFTLGRPNIKEKSGLATRDYYDLCIDLSMIYGYGFS